MIVGLLKVRRKEAPATAGADKVRDGGRVVNKALVVAHGVHETGRREILSIAVGEAETEAFWTKFLPGRLRALALITQAVARFPP